MTTVLLAPVYRGRLTKGGCKQIKLRAHLSFAQYDHTSSSLQIVSTLTDAGSSLSVNSLIAAVAPIETVTITPAQIAPTIDIAFGKTTAASLAAGAYTITTELRNISSGAVLHTTSHNLTRVDDAAPTPTSWIDEQQRLILKGKPHFPLGLYLSATNQPNLTAIGQSKFNMIMPYKAPNNSTVANCNTNANFV